MAKPSEKNNNPQNIDTSGKFKRVTISGATDVQPASIPKKYKPYIKVPNVNTKPNGRTGGMPYQTTQEEYDAVEQSPKVIPTNILATWGIFKDDVRELRIDCGSEVCEANAFKGIYNLQGILTLKNLKDIGFSAFEDAGSSGGFRCDFFVTPIEKIGQSAFAGCGVIGDVILPYTLTELGDRAFVNNFRTTKISIPATVTTFGNSVFENNTKVTEVILDEGLTEVGEAAFRNCKRLPTIYVPNTVHRIGVAAFENCSLLETVTIGGKADLEVMANAFRNCRTLKTVSFGDGVQYIDNSAFSGCDIQGALVLTSECDSVGAQAFYRGINRASITFPSNTFSLGSSAFSKCELNNNTFSLSKASSIGTVCFSYSTVDAYARFKLGSDSNRIIKDRAFAYLASEEQASYVFSVGFPKERFVGSSHFFPASYPADGRKPYYTEVTINIPEDSFFEDSWGPLDNYKESVVGEHVLVLKSDELNTSTTVFSKEVPYLYYYDLGDGLSYSQDVREEIATITLTISPDESVTAERGSWAISMDVVASDFNNSSVPNTWYIDMESPYLLESIKYYENLNNGELQNAYGYPENIINNVSYSFNQSIVNKDFWDEYQLDLKEDVFYSYFDAAWIDRTKFMGKITEDLFP